ncbi:MAG: hypothetical protein V1773_11095 [bacterium]
MKFNLPITILIIFTAYTFVFSQTEENQIKYQVKLNNVEDLFNVIVYPDEDLQIDSVFNFPITAPGIYANLNFGKYVKSFKVFNKNGEELKSTKINTNQWLIDKPNKIYKVVYDIEDTYDSELDNPKIPAMTGTALEEDFAIFNTFGILGYFEKTQNSPVVLELDYKNNWIVGTSLEKIDNNKYYAENYDKLADSPLLFGNLSFATEKVNNIDVNLYVYSPSKVISAKKLIFTVDTLLQSASEFVGFSPVNKYTFLMCLIPDSIRTKQGQFAGGALEHNQSSLYFLSNDEESTSLIKDVILHEFLHILTPLNVCSEQIKRFNFISPIPSQHIWFYEGVTEWASTIAQLRSGNKSLSQYLQKLTDYLRNSDTYDKNYSLSKMSLESYTEKGLKQFINFYNRGAVVAALLDIKLLELSNGNKGLRELLLELVKEYGQKRTFKDKDFFEIIIKKTYPEIGKFISDYICDTKSLPLSEFFAEVGIEYVYEKASQSEKPSMGSNLGMNEVGEIVAKGVTNGTNYGLQENDVILELFGEKFTMENIKDVLAKKEGMKIGDHFPVKIKRNGVEIILDGVMMRITRRHVFEISQNPSASQLELREKWIKNL